MSAEDGSFDYDDIAETAAYMEKYPKGYDDAFELLPHNPATCFHCRMGKALWKMKHNGKP